MEWRRENSGCDMPDRMLAEENFRMRDARIECWRRRIFGCRGRPSGMAAGGIPDAMCPDGMAAEEF